MEIAGTAAKATATTLRARCDPGRAICGRTLIVAVPTVLHPFPDVAVHVMKAERICRKLPDWGGVLPLVPAFRLSARIAKIRILVARLVTPPIAFARRRRTRHAPRRVFPLRFAQQPVRLSSPARQPRHIFFGVVPRYIDHWATAFAPACIARAPIASAAAGSHAGAPL